MRILLCISSLSTGGSERQVALLGCALQKRGHDVHVIYRVPGRFLAELQGAHVQCHQLRTVSNYSPTIFFKFFRLVKEIRPDVIHSWLEMMDILSGLAAKFYKIRWIASERSAGLPRRNPIGFWRNLMARTATQVVANSKAGQLHLQNQGFKNVSVINNAVLLPERTQSTVSVLPLRLLSISRLTRTKNYFTLLHALALLRDQSVSFHFDLVGGGEELNNLRKECERLGLHERVTFHGEKSSLAEFYLNSSAFISLSTIEGQPNTVLEAASFRCPLLLSDISTHVESIGNSGALFCNGTSPTAVIAMITHFSTESIAGIFNRTNAAYQSIANRSVQQIATEYESVYGMQLK